MTLDGTMNGCNRLGLWFMTIDRACEQRLFALDDAQDGRVNTCFLRTTPVRGEPSTSSGLKAQSREPALSVVEESNHERNSGRRISMLILSNEDIEKILPVGACLEVLEEAYRDLGNGMAATVPRYDVFSPTRPNEFYEYKTMSGVLPRRKIAALRLNSSVVKWYEKAGRVRKDKLPVAAGDRFVGLVMLFSTETGEPLAIFPDGYVQKLRVAGASAIAARYLARKESKVMALLGSGWQASAHLVTLCSIRDLTTVKVYSPTPQTRSRFVREMGDIVSAAVKEAASVEEALQDADIITCATNSISPLFSGDLLQPGVHVSCVKPCELDATTYKRSDPLII